MDITLNGESRTFPAALSIADLVAQLDLSGKRIAVEVNGNIVPRGQHAATLLNGGEAVEIVVAVGGG
jgi:sulfur carrier protein